MRIALPKGRLWAGLGRLLAGAGYGFAFRDERDYSPVTDVPGTAAKVVKPRAVPQLVALGKFDAGFCGLDLVRESGYDDVVPILDLGLAPVEIVVAVARGSERILTDPPRRPLVIATEYERMADQWALERNLAHITVQTWGSTEAYAPDDADVVFDCRETGATIEANGLVVVDRIMRSTTHLVANRHALTRPVARDIARLASMLTEVRS